MKILGQRWEYRIGNAVVMVDNAFSWLGWSQERLLVNGEAVSEAGGWFGHYRSFEEPWLSPLGDGALSIILKSQLASISCRAVLDGAIVEPVGLWVASWQGGRFGWPDDELWQEAPERSWIA